MNGTDKLYYLLKDLLVQLPSFLVLLVCMIFALIRWQRHRQVSVLVLLSFGWLLLQNIIFSVVYTWVPDWFVRSTDPETIDRTMRSVYLVLGLISNSALAIAFALLLAAIFSQRLANKDM